MGAGRQPSRINIDQDKFAAAARGREAAAATRERANSMNPSQLVQDNSSDYYGLDKFAAASRERANSMNPSQPGQDDRSDYFGPDKFAAAVRGREAAAATRERANSMNPSQPGQSNREDFSLDRFGTLLSNLEREKERLNRRKVRGMLM